jgi:hypothetical protein
MRRELKNTSKEEKVAKEWERNFSEVIEFINE